MKKINDYEKFEDSGMQSPPGSSKPVISDNAIFVIREEQKYRKLMKDDTSSIAMKLVEQYNVSFQFYRDFTVLVAVLAIGGMLIALGRWEQSFEHRVGHKSHRTHENYGILTVITIVALAALMLKYYFKYYWSDYKDPVEFHKNVIRRQIELGYVDETKVGASYKSKVFSFWTILTDPEFLFEAFILLLDPSILGRIINGEAIIEMNTVNWNDQVGEFHPHQHSYVTEYKVYDFLLGLMLLRLYFVLKAAAVLSPISRLYAKRICHERGFGVNFSYAIKASMSKYPGETYLIIFVTSVVGLAQLLRIFERPYYSLNFDPPIEDFRSLESAIFFTVMTMASAGFGDITASTRMGRWISLGVACWGAIMLSLLFSIIGNIFQLDENRLEPLFIIGE